MEALVLNPRRRRRRSHRRRNASPVVPWANPRRRRRSYRRRSWRRRNPTLSVMNPRGGGMMGLVMKGATVAGGAVLSRFLMAKIPGLSTQRSEVQALAQMGLGVALATMGRRFMGRDLAENLGVGAIAGGAQVLAARFLPGTAGLGLEQIPITESEVDREIRALVEGGVSDLGLSEDYLVQTLPQAGE